MICAERRSGALVDLDWTVRPKQSGRVRGFDAVLAREQCALIEAAYGQAEEANLFPAIEHLSSAFFRGHAHLVPNFSEDGLSIRSFEPLDTWNVCRDMLTGQWFWNPAASETTDFNTLEPIGPGEMVTLVRSRHVDYPAMAIYLRNALGEKAWGRFLERFGVPPVIIIMPELSDPNNTPSYMEAARDVADGGSGALPYGSQVTYAHEARGTNPFKEFLEHQQQLIVLMATGGMLTSLTGATGIGQGATDAHEETWRMIVRRDASAIATALNRTVTNALLDRAFPGKPHLAQFDFETEPPPSAGEVFDLAAKAIAAGYKITQQELEERTCYRLVAAQPQPMVNGEQRTEKSEAIAKELCQHGTRSATEWPFALNKAPITTGEPFTVHRSPFTAKQRALRALSEALQADLSPAAQAVQALLDNPSPEAAGALIERLPALLPDDPEMAAILEEELAAAFGDEAAKEATVANSRQDYTRGGNPDNRGQFSKTPGAGQREQETKSQRDDFGTTNEEKLSANPQANRARAKSVITHLLAKQSGFEPKALYRKDTGWIGIDYGTPGSPKKGEDGKTYLGGYGLSHILAKHPGAEEHLVDVLQKGECYKHQESERKLYLSYGSSLVVLTKHRTQRSAQSWCGGYSPPHSSGARCAPPQPKRPAGTSAFSHRFTLHPPRVDLGPGAG